MADTNDIMAEMEVYGSDGVHVGTVDSVGHARIQINTVASSVPVQAGHDHFVLLDEVARVEGNRVHMSVEGAAAVRPRPGGVATRPERGAVDPDATLNR